MYHYKRIKSMANKYCLLVLFVLASCNNPVQPAPEKEMQQAKEKWASRAMLILITNRSAQTATGGSSLTPS
jgi:hypothetical protein